MDDLAIANQLGQLTESVKGLSKTMDDFIVTQRVLTMRQEDRLNTLEKDGAELKGRLRGAKWVGTSALAIVSAIGAERIVQFLTGFPHLPS